MNDLEIRVLQFGDGCLVFMNRKVNAGLRCQPLTPLTAKAAQSRIVPSHQAGLPIKSPNQTKDEDIKERRKENVIIIKRPISGNYLAKIQFKTHITHIQMYMKFRLGTLPPNATKPPL